MPVSIDILLGGFRTEESYTRKRENLSQKTSRTFVKNMEKRVDSITYNECTPRQATIMRSCINIAVNAIVQCLVIGPLNVVAPAPELTAPALNSVP